MVTIEVDGEEYSGERLWRNEGILRELRGEQKLTTIRIGNLLECDQTTVSKWLCKYGIEIEEEWDDEDKLRELYVEKRLSAREIAEELGCSKSVIFRRLEKYNIERRHPRDSLLAQSLRNPDVPVRSNSDGYQMAVHMYDGEEYRVRIHRLMAVAEYGFDAVKRKIVHHGPEANIPWANWPGNLQLVERDNHQQIHHEERLEQPEAEWQDREVLEKLYHGRGLTHAEIAEKLGCTRRTVGKWIENHGMG